MVTKNISIQMKDKDRTAHITGKNKPANGDDDKMHFDVEKEIFTLKAEFTALKNIIAKMFYVL